MSGTADSASGVPPPGKRFLNRGAVYAVQNAYFPELVRIGSTAGTDLTAVISTELSVEQVPGEYQLKCFLWHCDAIAYRQALGEYLGAHGLHESKDFYRNDMATLREAMVALHGGLMSEANWSAHRGRGPFSPIRNLTRPEFLSSLGDEGEELGQWMQRDRSVPGCAYVAARLERAFLEHQVELATLCSGTAAIKAALPEFLAELRTLLPPEKSDAFFRDYTVNTSRQDHDYDQLYQLVDELWSLVEDAAQAERILRTTSSWTLKSVLERSAG